MKTGKSSPVDDLQAIADEDDEDGLLFALGEVRAALAQCNDLMCVVDQRIQEGDVTGAAELLRSISRYGTHLKKFAGMSSLRLKRGPRKAES